MKDGQKMPFELDSNNEKIHTPTGEVYILKCKTKEEREIWIDGANQGFYWKEKDGLR